MGQDDELLKLQQARRKDRKQATTRRRRAVESAPEAMNGLLTQYFGKDPTALRRIDEQRVLMAWKDFVGPAAAAVSRAERVRNHQLVVRVRDPLWMHQLYLLKNELIRQYRKAFPQLRIDDIYYSGS